MRERSMSLAMVISITVGCATRSEPEPTTRPSARQEKVMQDPFGYSPDFDQSDISGGGLTDFDRDGFNRDMNNVLNP